MDAFTLSFGIIFLAELGDKSQLMAMTFATRYRTITVLAAITAATAVTHLLSVVVGSALGAARRRQARGLFGSVYPATATRLGARRLCHAAGRSEGDKAGGAGFRRR